ncbi:hypothetical protein [Ichthyenterobacterium magnum]|uniref:DUF2268 domain-containing protein n=1 Tax=Ichthyenterobacterium magnum TaxID=1230530 RepID=A0A420DVB6_9FLAO|nr:hypothetical protein [Ichthyenterobacterium magnum]RKE98138.1 hypothetical protein BXY80_0212 [Ichthyenterobacterium magnum]
MKTIIQVCVLLVLLVNCTNKNKTISQIAKGKQNYTTNVNLCVQNNKISNDWIKAITIRHSEKFIDSLSQVERTLTKEEIEWYKLVNSRAPQWNQLKDSLKVPFGDIYINDTTYVYLGYQGHDDAFTYKYQTVCFNLTALVKEYGSAKQAKNKIRMDRFFAHEYTHLLSKEWAKQTEQNLKTFKDSILWECMYEGLGMYRSMSDKWFPKGDSLSTVADKTFETLYPIFTERLITIETSENLTQDDKIRLHKNLSRGSMKKKWGALPVAVWLAMESKGNDKNLIPWIKMGSKALIPLAKKYLTGKSKIKFKKVF